MIRLNKFLSESGICSRRTADRLIKEGKVKVNSLIVDNLGFKIDPEKDVVEVDGNIVKPKKEHVYIKIYKPTGYLTELGKDRFGRKTLTDLLNEVGIKERVFPAGRLDYNSEGLLILTDDGEAAYRITHPKHELFKEYVLKIQGKVEKGKLREMMDGKELEDGFFKPDKIELIKEGKGFTWLKVLIHSGKKRILRRYFKAFGFKVARLIRVRIGNITLGNLRPKEYGYIPKRQMEQILRQEV